MKAKRVALLLDSRENLYQALLAQRASERGAELGIEIVGPAFADGSSFAQLEEILALTRDGGSVEGIMISVAGTAPDLPAAKKVCRAGISMVYLNRIPDHLGDLRAAFPNVLVTGIAPDQEAVGQLQARQCLRLLPHGGFVLLVTGVRSSPSAEARCRAFVAATEGHVRCSAIDGRWTAQGAAKSFRDWFRLGGHTAVDVVVCQNDEMAKGVRMLLAERAQETATPGILATPILGCDGLPAEGQQMVRTGELTATVILPPTTPSALDSLAAFWASGERPERELLPPEPFPAASITPAPWLAAQAV